jgi:hypothetical protein
VADKLERLTELFRSAGAREPESWARSEVNDNIAQLSRYLFLRGAWKSIVADGDVEWIEHRRKPSRQPDAPLAGISPALERLLSKGIDPQDLTEVVRIMQYEAVFGVCYLLDDPYPAIEDIEDPPTELESIGWGLFEVDDDGNVGRPVGALHESMLGTDPTGREMRPRKR